MNDYYSYSLVKILPTGVPKTGGPPIVAFIVPPNALRFRQMDAFLRDITVAKNNGALLWNVNTSLIMF